MRAAKKQQAQAYGHANDRIQINQKLCLSSPPGLLRTVVFRADENAQQHCNEIVEATSAPIAGVIFICTGGAKWLSAEFINAAIISDAKSAQYTPQTNEISANTICFQSWCGSAVSTYSAAPASAHIITEGVAPGKMLQR